MWVVEPCERGVKRAFFEPFRVSREEVEEKQRHHFFVFFSCVSLSTFLVPPLFSPPFVPHSSTDLCSGSANLVATYIRFLLFFTV